MKEGQQKRLQLSNKSFNTNLKYDLIQAKLSIIPHCTHSFFVCFLCLCLFCFFHFFFTFQATYKLYEQSTYFYYYITYIHCNGISNHRIGLIAGIDCIAIVNATYSIRIFNARIIKKEIITVNKYLLQTQLV